MSGVLYSTVMSLVWREKFSSTDVVLSVIDAGALGMQRHSAVIDAGR